MHSFQDLEHSLSLSSFSWNCNFVVVEGFLYEGIINSLQTKEQHNTLELEDHIMSQAQG
jgi:hypothetical protein